MLKWLLLIKTRGAELLFFKNTTNAAETDYLGIAQSLFDAPAMQPGDNPELRKIRSETFGRFCAALAGAWKNNSEPDYDIDNEMLDFLDDACAADPDFAADTALALALAVEQEAGLPKAPKASQDRCFQTALFFQDMLNIALQHLCEAGKFDFPQPEKIALCADRLFAIGQSRCCRNIDPLTSGAFALATGAVPEAFKDDGSFSPARFWERAFCADGAELSEWIGSDDDPAPYSERLSQAFKELADNRDECLLVGKALAASPWAQSLWIEAIESCADEFSCDDADPYAIEEAYYDCPLADASFFRMILDGMAQAKPDLLALRTARGVSLPGKLNAILVESADGQADLSDPSVPEIEALVGNFLWLSADPGLLLAKTDPASAAATPAIRSAVEKIALAASLPAQGPKKNKPLL